MYNVLQLKACPAYLVLPGFVHLYMHAVYFFDPKSGLDCTLVTFERAVWHCAPLKALHTYSTLKEKGGCEGGPVVCSIRLHVTEMKACEWLPVIIPIKEQLRLGPVRRMTPVLASAPLLNIQ